MAEQQPQQQLQGGNQGQNQGGSQGGNQGNYGQNQAQNQGGNQNGNQQQNRNDPQELESKTILIQNKRFYLDVKENNRGRFLKIAEVTPGGHKNRVTMAMHILPEFKDLLSDFIVHYSELGPSTVEADQEAGEDVANRRPLKTARIMRGQRRYFLDLKENVRGRYLRVRAPGQTNDMPQQVIVVPASGMIEFRDTLTGLIENFGVDEEEANEEEANLPESATIGSRRSKVFYMDVGKNPRGAYVRMTEQSANYRQSITVPDRHFRAIGEWYIAAAEQLEKCGQMPEKDEYYGKGDYNNRNQGQMQGGNQGGYQGQNQGQNQGQQQGNQGQQGQNRNQGHQGHDNRNKQQDHGDRRRSRDDDEYDE